MMTFWGHCKIGTQASHIKRALFTAFPSHCQVGQRQAGTVFGAIIIAVWREACKKTKFNFSQISLLSSNPVQLS